MNFQQHVATWLQHIEIGLGRSRRTVDIYALALRRLGDFMSAAKRDPLKASTDDLVLFAGKWLYDQGLRDPVSRKTHIAAVRGFYAWLHKSRLTRSNPAEALEHPKIPRRLPNVMSLQHGEAMLWSCDFSTFEGVRDAAILAILMGCGLRVSGLVGLNESHLRAVRIGADPRFVLRVVEKGGKERQIPVPIHADLLLRVYLDHPELESIDRTLADGDRVLFVSTRNRMVPEHEYRGEARRLRRKGVNRLLQAAARRAGVPVQFAHPHAARHMFGTELAEHDVPTNTASTLMGHTDSKNTKIYEHLATRKMTEVIDRANPLAGMRTPVHDLFNVLKR